MKYLILIFMLISYIAIFAQEEDSTLTKGWTPTGVVGLNLSQVGFKNWSQGGEDALAFVIYSDLGAIFFQDPWKWKTKLFTSYGRTKLGDAAYRTIANEIYFETVGSRKIGWVVDPYVAVTVRTAITKGYDYETEPFVQIVDFFDPGYVTEAIGFKYDHIKIVTTRLGLAFQQTFANEFAMMYTDDPETRNKVEDFKFETGIESVTELQYEFLPNTVFASFLRLFTRFDAPDVWDVRWDNRITAKVNDYINVNLNVILVHEISQTRRTQIKEALQLGIVYALF